jgi:hypothetical protein
VGSSARPSHFADDPACQGVEEHCVELLSETETRVLEHIARAAEAWGAEWQPMGTGGRLRLPVLAGLRRGYVVGSLALEPSVAGCRLRMEVVERALFVHKPAVVVLGFSALGALATVLWPFFPAIAPVLPLAIILALCGWFLVVSRLQNRGPSDFLISVKEIALAEPGGLSQGSAGE